MPHSPMRDPTRAVLRARNALHAAERQRAAIALTMWPLLLGARRLREMIFAVLPVWFREEAAAICRKTLEDGGGKPLVQRRADLVAAFESIGVTPAQIERKVGRKIDALTAEDVATLGVVFKSIKRGEVSRDEEFPRDELEAPKGADGFEAASAGMKPAAESVVPPMENASPSDLVAMAEDGWPGPDVPAAPAKKAGGK